MSQPSTRSSSYYTILSQPLWALAPTCASQPFPRRVSSADPAYGAPPFHSCNILSPRAQTNAVSKPSKRTALMNSIQNEPPDFGSSGQESSACFLLLSYWSIRKQHNVAGDSMTKFREVPPLSSLSVGPHITIDQISLFWLVSPER